MKWKEMKFSKEENQILGKETWGMTNGKAYKSSWRLFISVGHEV